MWIGNFRPIPVSQTTLSKRCVPDDLDNYPNVCDPDQMDGDSNGVGDACATAVGDSNSSEPNDTSSGATFLASRSTSG
jgi:hypothetical protein